MASRIRDWGYSPGRFPSGPKNSILDVPGVKVGQVDLNEGSDIHTGVTVIFPRGFKDTYYVPSYAAFHDGLNEAGEWTGAHQVREWGYLRAPVAFTNTVSVGKVYDSLWRHSFRQLAKDGFADLEAIEYLGFPAVGETLDVVLNDVTRSAIEDKHVLQAIENAKTQSDVLEGNHGGGVAMCSHGYKGGTGTSSRLLKCENGKEYVLGVIVQNNYGSPMDLHIDGVPVGKLLYKKKQSEATAAAKLSAETSDCSRNIPVSGKAAEGSCLVLIITSAPLLPHQLRRLAQRATLGLGAVSIHGAGRHYSGEIFMAVSTGSNKPEQPAKYFDPASQSLPDILETDTVETVKSALMDTLFVAAAEATEEAVLNAMTSAETLKGFRGFEVEALPRKDVEGWLKEYGRSRIV